MSSFYTPTMGARVCIVCGKPCRKSKFLNTCSDACHDKLVAYYEKKFGKFKKMISLETGKAHKVPTRVIVGKGLSGTDLLKYPPWEDKDEN